MPRITTTATPTDTAIGARIRERRIALGLSQGQLAQMVGVTHQQFHKYERGINRIAAGRLQQIADALGTTVGALFEGLDMALSAPAPQVSQAADVLADLNRLAADEEFARIERAEIERLDRAAEREG